MGYIEDYIAGAESGTAPTEPEKVRKSEPVSFGTRLLASFKASDTGVENFLKSNYGPNRVARDEKGELIIATGSSPFLKIDSEGVDIGPSLQKEFGSENIFKDKSGAYVIAPKSGFTKFDPEGFDIGDVADVAPVATSLAAGAIAAGLTGGTSIPISLLTLAAAEGGGEVVNQTIGAALPGEEDISNLERVSRIGIQAGFGAAGPAIGKAAGTALKATTGVGKELVSRIGKRAIGLTAPKAAVAEEVSTALSAPLSVGEQTQNKTALLVEGFLRRNIFSEGIVTEADEKKLKALAGIADKARTTLSDKGSEEVSNLAVKAHQRVIENLDDLRRKGAASDFGEVNALAGGEKIFNIDNTLSKIDQLIGEHSTAISDSQDAAVVRFLEGAKKRIMKTVPNGETPLLTARQFQNDLSNWGKKAVDSRGIIEGVTNPRVEKRVAAEIFGSLNDDLNAAANSQGLAEEVAGSLRKARDNYRIASQDIAQAANNPLAEQTEPAFLAKKLASGTFSDEKIRSIMGFLDKSDPAAANELRSGVFSELLLKAGRTTDATLDDTINPAAIVNINKQTRGKLREIFSGNETAKKAYEDLVQASSLLARKQGAGSPTQPLQAVADILYKAGAVVAPAALAGGATYGATGGDAKLAIGAVVATAFTSRALAKAMVNPKASRSYAAIMRAAANPELYTGGPKKRALKQAVTDLTTFFAREDLLDKASGQQQGTTNVQLSTP